MRINWRLGLVLGLAISLVGGVGGRVAIGGWCADAVVPAGGPAIIARQRGSDTNGGPSEPAQEDNALSHPSANTESPPRPSRVSSFDRVDDRSGPRRWKCPRHAQARPAAGPGGTSAVAGKMSPSDAIGPYRARARRRPKPRERKTGPRRAQPGKNGRYRPRVRRRQRSDRPPIITIRE